MPIRCRCMVLVISNNLLAWITSSYRLAKDRQRLPLIRRTWCSSRFLLRSCCDPTSSYSEVRLWDQATYHCIGETKTISWLDSRASYERHRSLRRFAALLSPMEIWSTSCFISLYVTNHICGWSLFLRDQSKI